MTCTCTCAGTNPDYPWQHEHWCDLPERQDGCTCGFTALDPGCPEHAYLLLAEFEVSA